MALAVVTMSYSYAQKNELALTKGYVEKITKNFEAINNGSVYRHYYGQNILNEMVALNNAKKVYVFNGLDGNGAVHLVFKIVSIDGEIINLSYAYDEGKTCPPRCSPNSSGENIKNIGGKIAEGQAQQWVNNFQENYPHKAGVFSFSTEEFKKILASKNADGMFFSYGLDNGVESLVVGAVDSKMIMLLDNHLSIGIGEKISTLYPTQNMVKKN